MTGPARPEEVKAAYKASTERHDRERLLTIHLAQQGGYTLDTLAKAVMRGRSTVALWIQAYRQGGIEQLLEREHGGRTSSLPDEVREQLKTMLTEGRWKTAHEARKWLECEHGMEAKLSAVYH